MQGPRPDYTGLPANVDYGVDFELILNLPDGVEAVDGNTSVFASILPAADLTTSSVVLIDLGFSTHAVHMVRYFCLAFDVHAPTKHNRMHASLSFSQH